MPLRLRILAWYALGLSALSGCALSGCALVQPHSVGRSPLVEAQAAPDSVTLEVYFARFPLGNKDINESLWSQIDEQTFDAEARREWAQNGFRVGLVGCQLPAELVHLLKVSDERAATEKPAAMSLDAEPTVTKRLIQIRSGARSEVITSPVYDCMPLLKREDGQVRGRTYHKAEGKLDVRAYPEPDGRVRLEITPELHHGEPQQRWNGSDGIIRLDTSRPKQVLEPLRVKALLTPGQMLVMTSLVERPGSVGHYFFTEPTAQELAQKLLIIRVSQAAPDATFAQGGPSKKAEIE